MLRWLNSLMAGLIGLVLAAPILVVAGVSLNAKRSLDFPPKGLSLAWYAEIFTDPGWRGALVASLVVASSSAALAVAIAFPLAWFIWRWRAPWGWCFSASSPC